MTTEELPILGKFADQPWADEALCAQTDPDAFFPEKGGTTAPVKAVCVNCDVREQCLTWALDTDQRFGVWGGMSERERRKHKKQLPILAATGTDGVALVQATDDKPSPVSRGIYISATGHRPIPMATSVGIRPAHAPQTPRPTGLDWSKHTAPDEAPVLERCRQCRTPQVGLVGNLCSGCRTEAVEQFTVPANTQLGQELAVLEQTDPAVGRAAASYDDMVDRITHPEDHAQPPAEDEVVELPPYALDIAILMRDTEGHHDPAVRACRKTVVAALQGLNRIYTPPAPVAVPSSTRETATGPTRTPTGGRPRGSSTNTAEIARLYVDENQSVPQIAKALHHANATIRRALAQAGVQLRDDRSTKSGGRNAKTIDDYDPQLVADIRRRYVDEEQTLAQVATQIGASTKLVTTILNRAGITLRPPAHVVHPEQAKKLTDQQVDEICTRYQAGESSTRLAAAFNVSAPTILGRLRGRGITIRPKTGVTTIPSTTNQSGVTAA